VQPLPLRLLQKSLLTIYTPFECTNYLRQDNFDDGKGMPTTFDAPRALIVDDDEAFRELLTKQLNLFGCEVRPTSDASEFLAELSTTKKSYDLAVVDFRLPGLNGDQILSWIRQSELSELSTLPVLIITGNQNDLPASLLQATSISILFKPYEYKSLKAAVSRLLQRGALH
jgi:DNA-binding response OmpR family regulator